MSNTINGLTNYYSFFASPVGANQESPITKLMYGSEVSKLYARSIGRSAKASMSSYLSPLNSIQRDISSALDAKSLSSAYKQKAVTSADSGTIKGTASPDSHKTVYTVNISSMAKAQSNKSTELDSDKLSEFTRGTNTFSIKTNRFEKKIAINITENDTNRSALEKVAKGINDARANLTAKVASDDKGKSWLVIDADKTGKDSSFSVHDVTGNVITASGLSNIETKAFDSEYKVDGKAYTSQDNSLSLDGGRVIAEFYKAEGKDIRLTVDTDYKAIESKVEKLMAGYNKIPAPGNKTMYQVLSGLALDLLI